MKRLIPDVPFCDGDYYPCGHVVLDAMLRFYGYHSPTILHDEWSFAYRRQDDGGVWVSPACAPLPHKLAQAGVHVTERQESNGDAAWACARSRIDAGRPVPALADTYHLEAYYYPGLGHHSDHAVILAGYDDEAGFVHVVDPSPTKRFRGDLPLSGFKRAWGSEHIPSYTWADVRPPQPPCPSTPHQAAQTLRKNLLSMLKERGSLPGPLLGLHGMRTLADDLNGWKGLEADQGRSRLKGLFDQLRPVVMERDGHTKYLRYAADLLKMPGLLPVSDQLRGVTQKWLAFRNLCLKGSRKAPDQVLEKLPARLLEIASLEENALLDMQGIFA